MRDDYLRDFKAEYDSATQLITALVLEYGDRDKWGGKSLTVPINHHISESYDLTMYQGQDSACVVLSVTDRPAKVNKISQTLVDSFAAEVPTPELIKEAYKKAFGTSLD